MSPMKRHYGGRVPRDDIEILQTEHWSLLSTRSLGWNEMAGRTQMYLTAISGTVVALAMIAQGAEFGPQFRWFAMGLLPPLLFIGVVTFVRLVFLNLEDARWLQGMNRIRRAYVEASPGVGRYLVTSSRDDSRGLHESYAAQAPASPQIHAFFTTPGMVAVINAVVGAALAGIVAVSVVPSAMTSVGAAVAAFAVVMGGQWRFQLRVLARGSGLPPAFPHPERQLRASQRQPGPPQEASDQ